MTRFLVRTALLSALTLLLNVVSSNVSRADCGFTVTTADSAWTMQVNLGSTQTRSFWIKNTSDATEVFEISRTGSEAFTVTPHIDTLAAGDSVEVTIVFNPGHVNAAAGSTVDAKIVIAKVGSDCRWDLGLVGKVNGSNNGGHDAVVIFDPSKFSFGSLAQGADSCHTFTLINWTGKTIVLTGWTMLHDRGFTVDPSFSSNVTLDSGETKQFTICYTSDSTRHEVVDSLDVTWHYDGQSENHQTYAAVTAAYKAASNGGGSTGDAPLVADPHEYNFGAVAVGTRACKEIVIKNTSTTSTVVITGYSTCDNSNFSVSPAFNGNDTLAPGASMTITECYAPTAANTTGTCNVTFNYFTLNPSSDGKHLVVGFGGSAAGSSNGGDACMHSEQTAGYRDAIVLGASANRAIQLINNTGASITITNDSLACEDARAFTLTSQLPITIPAHSTVNFNYTFTPFALSNGDPKGTYSACILFWLNGDSITCHEEKSALVGFSYHDADTHTTDTVVRELYPNEHRVISIESHGDHPTKTFSFTNNLTVDVTVNGISLKNGVYFSISSTNPATTPFVLHPNDQMTVTIAYTATDNAVHYDTLIINSTHNLVSNGGFELQGVKAVNSSVRAEIPNGVTISLTPNPMSTRLTATITGTRTATIEVYDMLGKQLTTAPVNGVWMWNATADGGSRIASGSYIVRISGVSTDGVPFVTSKRLVVTND